MRKSLFLLVLIIGTSTLSKATEGMWLPLLLQQLNEQEMQSMGMKMTAEDIYSVNKGSLKDAIVHFGGFCTGEVISNSGLLLTNHHCGYRAIQSHSSLQNNYLEDGFWAMKRSEELPNPGLYAKFIVRIEDVTDRVLANVTDDMPAKERQSWIDKNQDQIALASKKEAYQDVMIKAFFEGSQYFMFVTETYNDVRLVGAPPSSIGKFGADTDNWVWPRHTGDFAVFRIYAGPDNKPAEYSEENVPLKPRHFLPVSMDGVQEGDFTMVFGFPGRTEEYLPHMAIDQRVRVVNPARIKVREQALGVLDAAMRNDPEVKIQYASKQSGISNAWKKWIGQSMGIKAVDGVAKRKAYDRKFQEQVMANSDWREKHGMILDRFGTKYKELEQLAESQAYLGEITGRTVELIRHVNTLHGIVKIFESSGAPGVMQRKDRIVSYFDRFYKDYRPEVDQGVFAAVMEVYYKDVYYKHISPFALEQHVNANKQTDRLAETVYNKTKLTSRKQLEKAWESGPEALVDLIRQDYAYNLVRSISDHYEKQVLEPYRSIKEDINELQSQFLTAQMEVFSERRFYPDANGTMRVTYGQVASYQPRDAVTYGTHTYLDGVMEKYVPGDYEFDVPAKLIELYENQDYGRYGENGKMPVCFIGSNHTTGGNSGSPAINGEGHLVGLNFDRVWEGTMSDIYYDASICRNIMVDARYILFIIDKYAGASHLVEEMELVSRR